MKTTQQNKSSTTQEENNTTIEEKIRKYENILYRLLRKKQEYINFRRENNTRLNGWKKAHAKTKSKREKKEISNLIAFLKDSQKVVRTKIRKIDIYIKGTKNTIKDYNSEVVKEDLAKQNIQNLEQQEKVKTRTTTTQPQFTRLLSYYRYLINTDIISKKHNIIPLFDNTTLQKIFSNLKGRLKRIDRNKLFREFSKTRTESFWITEIYKPNHKREQNIKQLLNKMGFEDSEQQQLFLLFYDNNNIKHKNNKVKKIINDFFTCVDLKSNKINKKKLQNLFSPFLEGQEKVISPEINTFSLLITELYGDGYRERIKEKSTLEQINTTQHNKAIEKKKLSRHSNKSLQQQINLFRELENKVTI